MNLLYKCLVLMVVFAPVYNAPRSKSKPQIQMETKYDQKQSGDYNIQVHLKDFQLVALLGGASDAGDYDYNYDYADLTVNPIQLSSTTQSTPSNATQNSEEAAVKLNETSTLAPSSSISTTLSPSSTPKLKPLPPITHKEEVVVVEEVEKTTAPPKKIVTTEKVIVSTEKVVVSTEKEIVRTEKEVVSTEIEVSSTQKSISTEEPTTKKLVASRINNKVVKEGKNNDEDGLEESKKEETPITNLGVLPLRLEGKSSLSRVNLHSHGSRWKKCGFGFARDKRGRCRKLKRNPPVLKFKRSPNVPSKIKHVASNLDTRFRSPTRPHLL